MRLESTVLTDLSANVFAALLLILLILLQARVDAPREAATPAPPRPVEATAELGARARAPLRAGEVVALLYDRRPDAPGLSLDLGERSVGAQSPGRAAADLAPGELDALLRAADPGRPVRLYVLSQRRYGEVAEALERSGRRSVEMSVPRSLRAPGGGWSPGFLGLFAARPDVARFRERLADLLAAPAAPPAAGGEGGGAPAAGGGSLSARFAAGLRAAVGVAAILAGLAGVLAIEALVPRAGRRYRPPERR